MLSRSRNRPSERKVFSARENGDCGKLLWPVLPGQPDPVPRLALFMNPDAFSGKNTGEMFRPEQNVGT